MLKPIIEEWLSEITMEEAVEMMLNVGIPAAPIYTIDKVVTDPHIADAREMFVDIEHPLAGKIKICGNQIKLAILPLVLKGRHLFLDSIHRKYLKRC